MNEELFALHRRMLFTVAYQMLGSVADADDVVQETWLRWAGVDHREVRDPRTYLVRIVSRQALNHLRTISRRRETYVGPWLPEPLQTSPDVAADVELAESVSIAMLVVLEALRPPERVVFVLREAFETPYDDIAAAVGKSPAAVRQIAHRARELVAAARPSMPDTTLKHQEAAKRVLVALRRGDLQALLDVLAPDVVVVADGGGLVPAARRPVHGAVSVGRRLLIPPKVDFEAEVIWLNGSPAVRIDVRGHLTATLSFVVEHGRITRVYVICNPHKLSRLDGVIGCARS